MLPRTSMLPIHTTRPSNRPDKNTPGGANANIKPKRFIAANSEPPRRTARCNHLMGLLMLSMPGKPRPASSSRRRAQGRSLQLDVVAARTARHGAQVLGVADDLGIWHAHHDDRLASSVESVPTMRPRRVAISPITVPAYSSVTTISMVAWAQAEWHQPARMPHGSRCAQRS